ncbi:hypothetical protein ES703_50304 [subsurface metagenome]
MDTISAKTKEKLIRLGEALVDQEKARVLIPPLKNAKGFWFGAGNVLEDKEGNFYLSGRYRNGGGFANRSESRRAGFGVGHF